MSKDNNVIAETKCGKLEGTREEGLFVFKGIPYAAPPTGAFRWLPPRPVTPWQGVRPALESGPSAPQNKAAMSFMAGFDLDTPQSEDCLYLNVTSPGLDDSRRPVLVWIHGGAFNRGSGSSPSYTGNYLCKRGDAVLVTINYRLGALGFLHLDTLTGGRIPATGNEGLLDQIAALHWVRDNIAAFGGDPGNVTVFGESAGGMSIGCLLAMPQARGLFHKAILQSGSNTVKLLDEAIDVTRLFLSILGIGAEDVESLKAVSVERILNAQQKLGAKLSSKGSTLEPVVDGAILPDLPIDAVKHGSAENVAILVGSNLEEAKFMAMTNRNLTKVDDAGLLKRWQQVLPGKIADRLIAGYRQAMAKYGMANPSDMALALQTARQFRIPGIRIVEAQQSRNQPAYSYLFTWKSPNPLLGACHALDVNFTFGVLNPELNGSGPAAEKLAATIQNAWLAFARTGNPGCASIGEWPVYGRNRATMILGEDCHVENAPYDEERRAWDPVPNFYLG